MKKGIINNLRFLHNIYKAPSTFTNSQFISTRQISIQEIKFSKDTTKTKDDPQSQDERVIKLFRTPKVQELLKELTGYEPSRVFHHRKIGNKLKEPQYTFMTEKQLEEALDEAKAKADKLLQMPPVLNPRKPINKTLSFDPQVQGLTSSTLLMIDTSFDVNHKERTIVARDPDGTLRYASWEEREKLINVYFPVAGKHVVNPRMFDPPILKEVLDRASPTDNVYEFILDRACLQLEPDDPRYISTAETTYERINEMGHYDFLRSTRHFGPMTFHLVRRRNMDDFIYFLLKNERFDDAVKLVELFFELFPSASSSIESKSTSDPIKKLENYIKTDALKKDKIQLALNAFVEKQEKQKMLNEGLKRSHGLG